MMPGLRAQAFNKPISKNKKTRIYKKTKSVVDSFPSEINSARISFFE